MRAVISHIPYEQPRTCYQNKPTSKRLGTQTCPFGRRSCCANRKRPPLRMASVDQGYAIRDGFPSSLSLEPNGHISASCHCHPLSIRSGLAPSSQLPRPKPQRFGCASALLRRHWTICLTPGQWCAECPGVGMLGRSVGKAGRQEKQAGEMSSSVWTGCLSLSLKEPRLFCFHKMPLS
jgi:hypothetical protein